MATTFRQESERLINKHSMENMSNTPDFILADYLDLCLRAFDNAVFARDRWYNIAPKPGWNAESVLTPEQLEKHLKNILKDG